MIRSCLSLLGIILLSYIVFPVKVLADEKFTTQYDTSYTLDQSGSAQVTQIITIENKETQYYAKNYTLSVLGKVPKNVSVRQGANGSRQENIPFDLEDKGNEQDIVVNFSKAVVGLGNKRTFIISYSIDGVASKNGDVWDIAIPKLANPETIDTYTLTLNIPKSYGNPAFISPQPKSRTSQGNFETFYFAKDDLIKNGITSSFGEFQIYSLSINYHLENPNKQKSYETITLPPDTAFQRVYYEKIDPIPEKITLDDDGNWIGTYSLSTNEKKDITVQFEAQVFAKPQNYYPYKKATDFPYYLSGNSLWQTTDPQITKIVVNQKSVKDIYNLVINTLTYDYSKIGLKNNRLGALSALGSPNNAICTEYTDLFVTLCRSFGIPAREVEGYAYTEDQKLQPLSQTSDILHSWPEYWDFNLSLWRPVDPTWEDTSGTDYFNKFDLSHVVFAIHGKDPQSPLPVGAYRSSSQENVQAEFGSLPFDKDPKGKLSIGSIPFLEIPFRPINRTFNLNNIGKSALYNVPVTITASGVELVSSKTASIPFLAPQMSTKIPVAFKTSFLPSLKPMKITIVAGEETMEYDIPKVQVYWVQIIAMFTVLLGLLVFAIFFLHLIPKLISKLIKKHER